MSYIQLPGGTGGGGDYQNGDDWTSAIATIVRDNFDDHEARIADAESDLGTAAAVLADHESRVDVLEAIPPPGLVLLEQHAASASAALDFTTAITSLYDLYVIEMLNIIPATDGALLLLRVSTDGGATFVTASDYRHTRTFVHQGSSSVGRAGASTDSSIFAGGAFENTTANGGGSGTLRVYNPLSATMHKTFMGECAVASNDGNHYLINFVGWYRQITAVNALRFLMDSGNIASGTIRMYGVKK